MYFTSKNRPATGIKGTTATPRILCFFSLEAQRAISAKLSFLVFLVDRMGLLFFLDVNIELGSGTILGCCAVFPTLY